jgi:hypothetical protein
MPGTTEAMIILAIAHRAGQDLQTRGGDVRQGLREPRKELQPAIRWRNKYPGASLRVLKLSAHTCAEPALLTGSTHGGLEALRRRTEHGKERVKAHHALIISEAHEGEAIWGKHPRHLEKESRNLSRRHAVDQEVLHNEVNTMIIHDTAQVPSIRLHKTKRRNVAAEMRINSWEIIEIYREDL